MRYRLFSLVLLFVLAYASCVQAQENTNKLNRIAVRAARMLDVQSGQYVTNAVILVEAERIKAVGANLPVPAGAQVLDLGEVTLLPGLIDCHTHLLQSYNRRVGGDDNNIILTVTQMSTAKRALLGVKMGREDLEAGITSVRDVGNSGMNGAVALRDAINEGWVVGPRIVACTRALSPTSGQFPGLTPEVQNIITQEYAPISGVEEARKAVRQALYDGADCIKVITDSGPLTLSLEEMKTIVEEAHRVGKKVAAHAIGDLAVTTAAQAGVDSIEHAYALTDAQAKLMAQNKVFLVPTDMPLDVYLMGYGTLAPEARQRGEYNYGFFTRHCRERLVRALKAGVRIAAGSDMYSDLSELTRGQASLKMLNAYAEAGMPPLDVIRAATLNAAELIGLRGDVGSLEAGKFADIVAVTGDPLKDITALQRVCFVMKGGAVIKNDSANAKRDDTVTSAVESAAKTFMENGQTVGLSIGIYKDGQTYTYNFGTTERGKQSPPTAHTRYPIASITKTFTGTLLAQATVEKKVNLDDDVRKYLDGEYPNLEYQGQPIRLWQLINHTSGLPNISPLEKATLDAEPKSDAAQKSVIEAAYLAKYTKDVFFRELHEVKLTRVPGVSFSYSNIAAQLLGLVLERVYGKPYEEILRLKITGPLQMNDTKITLTPAEMSRLPYGYCADGAFRWPLSTRFPSAGALKSTTADMLKYIAWNLAEKDAAVKLAHQPAGNTVWSQDGSYTVGLNWQILKSSGQRNIFQDGNVPGYHCMCVLRPELNLGIIVLTNEEDRERSAQLSPLIDRILKAIDPRVAATP